MSRNKFTILIPTRNRADVLRWSLQTCVAQDYDDLEIIVSDNFSDDNTREVVASFSDPRIRYINPGERLSMSANWEFGLSHIDTGYVSILGDDDGFVPEAVSGINDILSKEGLPAICWYQSTYYWPNNPFLPHELFVLMRNGYEIRNGLENYQKVISYKEHYSTNPWLYGGFIDISVIKKIKHLSGGAFFHSMIPDIYSGLAIAAQLENYVYSMQPYSIAAISAHSNGAAQFSNDKKLQANFNTFLTEAPPLPYHPQLEFIPSSFAVIVAECAMQTFDHGLISDRKYYPDLELVLRTAIEQSRYKSPHILEREIDGIRKVAEKNGIDIAHLLGNAEKVSEEQVKKAAAKNRSRKKLQGKFIDGDRYALQNVYDASLLHDKIYQSGSKLFFNFVKKVSDVLTKMKN